MAETRVTEGHDDHARVLMQDTFAVLIGRVRSPSQEQAPCHRGTLYVSLSIYESTGAADDVS
jgi:hypothetical protein